MFNRLVFIALLLLPVTTQASVFISEVAWMGSANSANHEWIELRNDGPDIDVTGWRLHDGMNLNIVLDGNFPVDSYAVLERTSDDTAPGTAFMIYTGALVNTGAVLRLERPDGTVVDQVSGGENWQAIGGDNVTKETAQYTPSGWVTAVPTPGAPPPAGATVQALPKIDPQPAPSSAVKVTPSKQESVRLSLPANSLKLAIDTQALGYVNQTIKFKADPSGIGDTLIDSLVYTWNFGDGHTANSKEPKHTFAYPGKYVVTVHAGFKRQEQVARYEITILPVTFSLTFNQSGDVQVNNDSPYEVDLSGYTLQGEKTFQFSPRTVILPGQTITLNTKKIGSTKNRQLVLYDTASVPVARTVPGISSAVVERVISTNEGLLVQDTPSERVYAEREIYVPNLEASSAFGFVETASADTLEITQEIAVPNQPTTTLASTTNPPERTNNWPYLVFAGVLLTAVVGILLAPRLNRPE